MNKHRVDIENLNIRIPRSTAGAARTIADGLAKEILRSIARSSEGKVGVKQIAEISAGSMQTTGDADARGVQMKIASRVVDELQKNIG